MQKDQIVVAMFGQSTLGANSEGALLQAGEPSCSLGTGLVTIPRLSSSMPASAMNSCPFVNVPTTSGR
jgi:hypothetical protein